MRNRTPVSLDADILLKLEAEARRCGLSLDETVNSHLRRSLNDLPQASDARPFRIEARDMGLRPGLDLDNIGELLDRIDGPLRR